MLDTRVVKLYFYVCNISKYKWLFLNAANQAYIPSVHIRAQTGCWAKARSHTLTCPVSQMLFQGSSLAH